MQKKDHKGKPTGSDTAIIQLKKHNPSRKRFHNKTKKKYNSKSIDKILSKMTNKKVEMIYKDLLLNEKSTKRN